MNDRVNWQPVRDRENKVAGETKTAERMLPKRLYKYRSFNNLKLGMLVEIRTSTE